MNIFRNSLITFLLLLVTISTSTSCASYKFKREVNQLKPGMTKEEVQSKLGTPTGIERKQITNSDLRENWIYHVYRINPLTPLYPDLYILTFSNGKLLGWNLPNPYDPNLVSLLPPSS